MERKPKILIVDDDPDFLESTRTILESKPYKVIVAENGSEGLRKAKAERPDLIILDIIMPGEDGFSVAGRLKKDPQLADIPLLMLTSFSSKGAGTAIPRSRGYELEAEDYIDKPVKPRNLLDIVEKHLSK